MFLSIVPMLALVTPTLTEGHEPDARFCRDGGVHFPVCKHERALRHPAQRLASRRGARSA